MAHQHKSKPQQRDSAGPFDKLSPLNQDLLSIALLYIVALLVFRGIIFDNAAFAVSGDTAAAMSFQHAGSELTTAEGQDAIWMPYFFSGMPTFGNVAFVPHNLSYVQEIVVKVVNFLFLNGSWTWFVVYYLFAGVFAFLLARALGFDRIPALIVGLTNMLSPYAVGLAAEGHGSKLMAISYVPLVLLLLHQLFTKRTILWLGLLAAALGTLLLTNHMQIVYYALMLAGCYLLYQIVIDWKEHKNLIPVKIGLFLVALAIGFGISSYIYLSVREYAQFSIRGGGTAGSAGGLTYDYATNWSWSLYDVIGLIIPGFYGLNGPSSAQLYWGHVEPWTNAYVYVGLVPVVLAVIGVIYKRTPLTIFFLSILVFVVIVSLGRNFPILYDLMFSYLPFFNKFRAPQMILHLLPLLIGLLGAVGYEAVIERRKAAKADDPFTRTIMIIAGIAAGFLVASFALKSSIHDFLVGIMFMKDGEAAQLRQQYGAQFNQAVAYFTQQRFEIFWRDWINFLLFATGVFILIWLYMKKTISGTLLAGLLLTLSVIDVWILDARLINPQPRTGAEESFKPTETVSFLKSQGRAGEFRVLPLPLFGPQWDNTLAYHGIESVGGYSPAKLKIYQTMLDSCMTHGPDPSFPLNMNVVDMLNAKFLLVPGRLPEDRFKQVSYDPAEKLLTYENPGALPRAWFVDSVVVVQNDTKAFSILNSASFAPGTFAVIQQPAVIPAVGKTDSTSSVKIAEYQSRHITMNTTAPQPSLLVVSEIYYPAGWKALVDGNETEIFRTNSVLRSVVVPSGSHKVEMVFDPPTYTLGYLASNISWAVVLLSVLLGLWLDPGVRALIFRKKQEPSASV
jgi:hypothetical protein